MAPLLGQLVRRLASWSSTHGRGWFSLSLTSSWIAKPKNNYAGAGIVVYPGNSDELQELVKDSENHPKSLVQRYLADPLLIGGYKFHMRIHLCITSLDPLEGYVQENGQCLF